MFRRWGLASQPQECVWVVAYDAIRHTRSVVEVARGSTTGADIHIPSVMAAVLTAGADRFLLAHNHPSNDPRPTPGDIETTYFILEAANACGLYMQDHLIVMPSGQVVSLAQLGVFTPAPIETVPAVNTNA